MDVTRQAQGTDLVIAGCRVHLRLEEQEGRWQAEGTIRCGLKDNRGVYRFRTDLYPTIEEAEQEALRQAAAHLGNNVDRQTSRVTNWDGLAHDHTE